MATRQRFYPGQFGFYREANNGKIRPAAVESLDDHGKPRIGIYVMRPCVPVFGHEASSDGWPERGHFVAGWSPTHDKIRDAILDVQMAHSRVQTLLDDINHEQLSLPCIEDE